MESTILFAVSVLTGLIMWNKISRRYLWLPYKNLELKKATQPILLLHLFRFAGLSFLIPGVVHAGLNAAWAIPAAFGDFAAAVLAFITLSLVNNNTLFRASLWIFNILGFADLIVAFIDGPRYNILPFLSVGYFIIILYVPVLLLTHLMVFKLLFLKTGQSAGKETTRA
ncbi:MAG: hypothetical protein ACTHJ8_18530 [Mucilaginibacter sp.]